VEIASYSGAGSFNRGSDTDRASMNPSLLCAADLATAQSSLWPESSKSACVPGKRIAIPETMQPAGTILVVDDLESNRKLLRDMLESGGHRVLVASDGPSAIEMTIKVHPEVILLDVKMPGMDGFEVCARLKAMAETSTVPVIFVTANYTDEQDLLHGLELGGSDYLVKPVSRAVLLARVGVMLRIRRTEERIRQLSMIDEFTGLFSKSYVLQRLDEEIKRAQRRDSSLVVTMLDLDDFKQYNDSFGHQFGDEVLKKVSASLKANVRLYDSLGRYGGEEFLLVQPDLGESEAMATVERLKEKVQEERFYGDGRELRVTFSAGIALWAREADPEEMVRRADTALYAAKHAGKNQTVCHSELGAGRRQMTVPH
jgi:diguanylate cyclase (GGDEF)-like protein